MANAAIKLYKDANNNKYVGINVADATASLSYNLQVNGTANISGALSAGSLSLTTALPVASGGTGRTTLTGSNSLRSDLGFGTGTGALAVANGGTGSTTLTSNAILAGNGTSAINKIATASGALYATAANGAASFGTLPIAQGGTGATSAANARTNLGITPANIGAKATQTAVSDPAYNGDSITFIDTISQNTQGVISVTKKMVRSASETYNGIVTITTQSFAGNKTLNGNFYVGALDSSTERYLEARSTGGRIEVDSQSTKKGIWVSPASGSGSWIVSVPAANNSATFKGGIFTDNIGSESSTTHATALQNYFNSYKSTTQRNVLDSFYDNSYQNGSVSMGYFLDGYDDTPYGGFYVAHYDKPYYVGINAGTYTQGLILTNKNASTTSNIFNQAPTSDWIQLSTNGVKYWLFLFIGIPGSSTSYSTTTVPVGMITTDKNSPRSFLIADESRYHSFYLYKSSDGSEVYIKNNSGSGGILAYGMFPQI